MTPIKAERKTKAVNFGEKPVDAFWLEIPASSSAVSSKDCFSELQNILETGIKNGVVCVFSEELAASRLCELLAKIRDNGNRVYILVNDFNEEMKNLDGCLIRYGGSRKIGSFILVNPNSNASSGCLFTGRLSDGSFHVADNLLLHLDEEQISVLFRYFCCQFWKLTAKERVGSGEQDTGPAPVDIYPPKDNGCDFQYLQSVWSKEIDNALVTTTLLSKSSFFKFDTISNSKIVSLFAGIDNDTVCVLAQKKNIVIAVDDVCLVNSFKTAEYTWLVPKIDVGTENEVYALLLNPDQSRILDAHLSESKTNYRYVESEIRKDIEGETIVNLGDTVSKKYTINREKHIKLETSVPQELFPKEKFDANEPVFQDDERSVSIVFEWTNRPFTLPSGSAKHTLYSSWQSTQESITAHIEGIMSVIAKNEEKEKTISNTIKQFFLGKQQKFKEYRNELEVLKNIVYASLKKNDLQEKIKKINSIQASVTKDAGEITEENRKARIQENISAKQKDKAVLETELSTKETEIAGSKSVRLELTNYAKRYIKKDVPLNEFRKDLEKQIEMSKKEGKNISDRLQEKLEDVKRIMKELEDMTAKQSKLESEAESIKKNIKALEDQVKEKENISNDLQKKLDDVKRIMKELEDMTVKQSKLESDAESIKKNIKRQTDAIKSLEDQLKDSGSKKNGAQKKSSLSVFQPAAGKSSLNPADLTNDLPIPPWEQLPSTGELYQYKGKDYLAITYWEEYDEGEKEAERLHAALCAKGEK